MSDLGDELRATIDGAASPVSFDEIAVGVPAARRRAPWRTVATATVAVVVLVAGAVVVSSLGGRGRSSQVHVAAPTVAVGNIDLAVLATGFDEDGARAPVSQDVVDAVRGVAGVAGAEGAMQRFVEVLPSSFDSLPPASTRSAIAISWEQGAPLDFAAGGPPTGSGEVAINQSLADQYGIGVGADVAVYTGPSMDTGGPSRPTLRVTGVFTPAGGDVDDINLVVLRSVDLAEVTVRDTFDRVDIVAADGVPIDELVDRITAALPEGYMVVPPSVVGFDSQLRAELEIQRAYHWLLDADAAKRQHATDATPDPATAATNQQTWEQHVSETVNTELRVSRVAFVDNATALVTYRVYYGGQHSPIADKVMTGVVIDVDGSWRISQRGICELASIARVACDPGNGPDPASLAAPPDGWNRADAEPGAADAFRVLANPAASADQRVAVIENGEALRRVISAGVAADVARAGQVEFRIAGTRLLDATHAQVLYSVIASGEPHLETPYPLVGSAVLVDGAWRVRARFACGLSALAAVPCPAETSTPATTSTPTTSTTRAPAVTPSVPSTITPETATTVVVSTTPPTTTP